MKKQFILRKQTETQTCFKFDRHANKDTDTLHLLKDSEKYNDDNT